MLLGGSRSMQRYDRFDEDLDRYEDDFIDEMDDVDANQYEDEEDEEEEREEEHLSEEAVKYLSLREKLKRKYRSISTRGNGATLHHSLNNFGNFFGPSRPVIADRVIQERKSFKETQHMMPKVSTSQNDVKRVSLPSTSGSRNGLSKKPISRQEIKTKAQLLKDTRDYGFLLSDDAELPKPAKDVGLQKCAVRETDARSAQVQVKRKDPAALSGRKGFDGFENRMPSSGISRVHTAQIAPSQKFSSSNRASLGSSDSRRQLDSRKQVQHSKQLVSSNGNGLRPGMQKVLPPKKPLSSNVRKPPVGSMEKKPPVGSMVKKPPAGYMDKKPPAGSMEKKRLVTSAVAGNSSLNRQRLPMMKSQHSGVNNRLEHRRDVQQTSESRMLKKENVPASKFQTMRTPAQGSIRGNLGPGQKQKPTGRSSDHSAVPRMEHNNKRRRAAEPLSDEEDEGGFDSIRSTIQRLMGYRPKAYADDSDDDDCMEVGFETIQKEENLSAKIARQEDDEEWEKIKEEEKQDRLRKMRKMSRR